MTTPVQFYFDFSSPYAYLAAMKIDELAAKYGREVDWHPVLLGIIFKTTETKPLVALPLKGPYSRLDLARSARFHNIPFALPTVFPSATQHAARAMLWIQNQHGSAVAKQFARKVLQAYFVDDVAIGAIESVVAIAQQCQLDGPQVEAGLQQTEIKDLLKAEVDHAISLGVFGAPYIMIDGEPFWGFDRFDQIEATLKNGKI